MTTLLARRPSPRGVALLVSLVVVTVLPFHAGRGAAQEPVTAPALAATVVPSGLDPVEIRVDGFRLESGEADAAPPTAVVSFAEPFTLPRDPWRLIVSAGAPDGQRVRTTLVSVAGTEPAGRVERGDGVQWEDLGEAVVSADTESGEVRLAVPLDAVDAQAVMWVEAEITQEGEILGRRTPTVALVDLRGERPGPALGTSPYAEFADGGAPGALAVDAPGPVVQVVGRALELTTAAPAPGSVDGAEVVDVIDSALVTQATTDGSRTDRIEVDRRTGEVRLTAVGAEPFVAVPGFTPWLVNPPSTTAPGSPATVTFDLEALNEAVGGPAFDRSTTQVAAERLIALDDGRILVAAGVNGTLAWFDDGLGASTPAAAPAEVDTGASTGLLIALVAGIVVLVAGIVVARLVVVRRRRRAEAAEPRPIDRIDALGTESVWLEGPRSLGSRASSSGLPSPGVDRIDALSESPPPSAERVDVPASTGPTTPPPDLAAPTSPATPKPSAEPAAGSGESSERVADPLAAFLADVDALSARVDRLGGAGSPADADEPDVGRGTVEQASR